MSNTVRGRAHFKDTGFMAVVSTDPVAFVATLMLFCTVVIVVGIFVHSQVTGIQPRESWTEISVGLVMITAAFLAVVTYRVKAINRLLSKGIRQVAHIDRFLAHGIWVIVQLKYERQGIQSECKIWLANSRRSRWLGGVSEITLAMESTHSSRVVITELFL
jgi:hypothetical protein